MIPGAVSGRRAFAFDRPTLQWDSLRGMGASTVRLFGRLGARELRQVTEALAGRGSSPRDLICIDFEQVEHVDFCALPEFVRALVRHQNRGASLCLVGLSRYVRNLFDAAGEGPSLRQLLWTAQRETVVPRRPFLGLTTRVKIPGDERRDFWR
ncbi:MAG: STAS domain-containing protein [Candidatus Latescibacteria bacterium]|nr:STAS domain-containing protein [Candidatus Latescibacterota bacterium]